LLIAKKKEAFIQNVRGYILAGGKSSRMGRDKRFIEVDGISLIEKSIRLLESVLGERPALVGDNLNSHLFGDFEILKDAIADKGPVGGLVSCLRHCDAEWALVLPVDMPHLARSEIEALLQSADEHWDVIALSFKGWVEPLVALYNTRTVAFWAERLNKGELALYRGIERLRTKVVNARDGSHRLMNINTPEDLASRAQIED